MEWWLSQRDAVGSGGAASCAQTRTGDIATEANSNETIDFTMMTPSVLRLSCRRVYSPARSTRSFSTHGQGFGLRHDDDAEPLFEPFRDVVQAAGRTGE